jgi:DNA-binding beta-propeller fold protein YncE
MVCVNILVICSESAESITNGVAEPNSLAFDSNGNLYVTNGANSTVAIYNPPFSTALRFEVVNEANIAVAWARSCSHV